jgi:hypothetical protein
MNSGNQALPQTPHAIILRNSQAEIPSKMQLTGAKICTWSLQIRSQLFAWTRRQHQHPNSNPSVQAPLTTTMRVVYEQQSAGTVTSAVRTFVDTGEISDMLAAQTTMGRQDE